MALTKQLTSGNGIPVTYHKIIKAELTGTEPVIRIQMGSWVSEQSFISGAPAVWVNYTGVASGDLYEKLQQALLLTDTYEGASIVPEADTMDALRERKWQEIKQQQLAQERGGFEYAGNRYNSDLAAQTHIQGAALQAMQDPSYTSEWTLENNSTITLTAVQLQELNQALIQHVESTHQKAQNLRQAIREAQTPEQLDKITW